MVCARLDVRSQIPLTLDALRAHPRGGVECTGPKVNTERAAAQGAVSGYRQGGLWRSTSRLRRRDAPVLLDRTPLDPPEAEADENQGHAPEDGRLNRLEGPKAARRLVDDKDMKVEPDESGPQACGVRTEPALARP